MNYLDRILASFIDGDYFIVFLLLILIIMIVLILALIKTREENQKYIEHYESHNEQNNEDKDQEDFFDELDLLKATTKEDLIDEDAPLVKQINIPEIKTYNDLISDYEEEDEENAVISASELERRTQERLDALGTNDNKIAIEKYEEDQENKAIISYEQLLKNAKNITLSYKEEDNKDLEAPKINKVEITQKEVSAPENYLEEEEFLKILKSFRMSL